MTHLTLPAQAAPTNVCTASMTALAPNPAVVGTNVVITGTVKQASSGNGCAAGSTGTPVTAGKIQIQENEVTGEPVACATPGLCTAGTVGAVCTTSADCGLSGICSASAFVTITSGTLSASGQLVANFATTGLANSTAGFLSHYIGGNTGYKESVSACTDLKLNLAPWSMFHHDVLHTGLSPIDTSADTGTQKWKFATGGYVFSSPAIGGDGTIYVGSLDDNLYGINPDGTQKWKFATGYLVVSSAAIGSDGTIYVGSGDNYLYAINPDGTQKWKFATGAEVFSSPAIGSDGTIYVGSYDGNLYAAH